MSKITGNEVAFPFQHKGKDEFGWDVVKYGYGMTLRQYYAGLAQVDANSYTMDFVSKIMGCDPPNFSTDLMGNIKYWNDFEALIKVMKADALIQALNKTPQ